MMPMDAMAAIPYGDLASAILALIAVIFLRYRLVGAISVAWLVNIVTSLEWLYAAFLASSRQLATYAMGGNSYIMNYYVPVIAVIRVMIFARRIRSSTAASFTKALMLAKGYVAEGYGPDGVAMCATASAKSDTTCAYRVRHQPAGGDGRERDRFPAHAPGALRHGGYCF